MPNEKCDRAKLFLPFDALKGFREALREREIIYVDQRELSEEENEKLGLKIRQIQKGSIIKIVYYKNRKYIEMEGMVSKIDFVMQFVVIVQTKIKFADIFAVSGDDINIEEFPIA